MTNLGQARTSKATLLLPHLVPGDELVAEGEAGHQAALLQPEDGGEGAGEEDSFDGGESDDALGVRGVVSVDPRQSPVSLLFDCC